MDTKEKTILRYKEALIDNYYDYLNVMEQLNTQIPILTEDLIKTNKLKNIEPEKVEKFTYKTFCESFLNNLKAELDEDNGFTISTINNIFMVMIEDKILQYNASSSGESTTLENECE